RARSIL
ncbi:unnamed protein product, partial [Rhizophagus irregularis]